MSLDPPGAWWGRALDVAVAIHVEDPGLGVLVERLLRDLAGERRRDDSPVVRVDVRGSGPWAVESPEHHAVATTRPEAVSHTLTALNLSAVAATPQLAMHAAVVVRAGGALVVPGASGHGKTTLTGALVGHGWDYVSDEALCLRWDDARIVPYPRPLALSPWASDLLGAEGVPALDEVIVRPEALGGRAVTDRQLDGVRVRHVVTLRRQPGAAPELTPLHRADALAALLARGFTHHRSPAAALALVHGLVATAECWELTLSDPRDAAALLTRRLA